MPGPKRAEAQDDTVVGDQGLKDDRMDSRRNAGKEQIAQEIRNGDGRDAWVVLRLERLKVPLLVSVPKPDYRRWREQDAIAEVDLPR